MGPGSRTGEGLGLPLLYWHFWRERLARPEQSRLQRKEKWAFSDLLFPNSQGRALQRQVLHDALSRMQARHRGPAHLTPSLIRKAFYQSRVKKKMLSRASPGRGLCHSRLAEIRSGTVFLFLHLRNTLPALQLSSLSSGLARCGFSQYRLYICQHCLIAREFSLGSEPAF